MLFAVEYNLPQLLGVAGATVIFILVGAVLMGGFNMKYIHLCERYRGLTAELRQKPPEPRRTSLAEQVASYLKRIRVIFIASVCIAVAVLLFLVTVSVASLSVIYPTAPALRDVGTWAVLTGLGFSGVAVALDLAETLLSSPAIQQEVADIPEVPQEKAGV
jgi:hypothetical protein